MQEIVEQVGDLLTPILKMAFHSPVETIIWIVFIAIALTTFL